MADPLPRLVHLVYETHSTSTDNERGIATGWLPGELSPTGRRQAAELGERRRDGGFDLVLSSDLRRAVETVEIAFAGRPVERRTDPRLRECDYGELNGAPVAQVHAQRRQRLAEPYPGGQSFRQVTEGVAALLAELLETHAGRRVLLVGHSATRYALEHLLSARPLEAALSAPFTWRPGWCFELTDRRPRIDLLDGAATLRLVDELSDIYRDAFVSAGLEGPEGVARFAAEQLPRHVERPGFRCVVLDVAGAPSGFAYGYTGERGQWWSDWVAANTPAEAVDEWVGGHFEVVELAVRPILQRRGFATALHDALLADLPHERALLTTSGGDDPAPRLYRRLGWKRLHEAVGPGSDLYGIRLADR